jgi:GntR family transcriptional repressor for pyruvate dehydrogenase complex
VRALHSSTYPASYLQVTSRVARTAVKQHMAIAAAIESADAAAADAAMVEHLDYVLAYSTNCSRSAVAEAG